MRPLGPERIAYRGRILEIVEQEMLVGGKKATFEYARRSPGVRLIIVKNGKMLLTKEYRNELKRHDLRLPGGKVFDTLAEYGSFKGDLVERAKAAAIDEARQETGILPNSLSHYATLHCGATVVWDLYYFIVKEFDTAARDPEAGEEISCEWFTLEEIRSLCLDGSIQEDRSVAVLLRFLNS